MIGAIYKIYTRIQLNNRVRFRMNWVLGWLLLKFLYLLRSKLIEKEEEKKYLIEVKKGKKSKESDTFYIIKRKNIKVINTTNSLIFFISYLIFNNFFRIFFLKKNARIPYHHGRRGDHLYFVFEGQVFGCELMKVKKLLTLNE